MDSIKSKVIRAPQMSGIKTITSAALPTGAATYDASNANAGYEDNFKIVVPKGAIILATPFLVKTAFSGGTNYGVDIGIPAASYEDDGTSHNGGNKTVDAYFKRAAATNASAARGMFGRSGASTSGLLAAGGLGLNIGDKATYVLTANGEREYSVHLSMLVSGVGASTAGELIWWVEYGFDPNIVWDQDDLA